MTSDSQAKTPQQSTSTQPTSSRVSKADVSSALSLFSHSLKRSEDDVRSWSVPLYSRLVLLSKLLLLAISKLSTLVVSSAASASEEAA